MKNKYNYLIILIIFTLAACKKVALDSKTSGQSLAKEITSFSFSGLSPVINATIDNSAKTILPIFDIGTDVFKLTPTITISKNASVSPASGVPQDFSKEISYTITAEDGSTQTYLVKPRTNHFTTTCKLNTITSINNVNLNTTVTHEYDSRNRMVKQSYRTYAITYVYDQNDFLTERSLKYTTSTIVATDKFSYNNEKLIAIENNSGLKTKTTYTYDTAGNLSKMTVTDSDNRLTESFYKNNLLIAQSDNSYTYEVNVLGQITKAIRKAGGSFSTIGDYSLFYYDKNGQNIKIENVNKDGAVVSSSENQYSEFRDLDHGNQDYMKGKGFPIIGPILPNYLIKRETTYLLNNSTKQLEFHVGFTSENYKVDGNGRLLTYTGTYKTTNPKDDATYNFTYNYTGCN